MDSLALLVSEETRTDMRNYLVLTDHLVKLELVWFEIRNSKWRKH